MAWPRGFAPGFHAAAPLIPPCLTCTIMMGAGPEAGSSGFTGSGPSVLLDLYDASLPTTYIRLATKRRMIRSCGLAAITATLMGMAGSDARTTSTLREQLVCGALGASPSGAAGSAAESPEIPLLVASLICIHQK